MKRKASNFLGSELPPKLKKESTAKTVDETLTVLKKKKSETRPPLPLAKFPSSSGRQRKAPSWLSSYVTNSAQEKELKNEKVKKNEKVTKPNWPRFPTLVPPSKQKDASIKKVVKDVKPVEPSASLRRQSTLKLQSSPNSTEPISSVKTAKTKIASRASLARKSTEILNLSSSSSSESLDSKYSVSPPAGKKITVLSKTASKLSNSSSCLSESKLKVKKSSLEKRQVDEVDSTQNCSKNIVEICDNKHFTNLSGDIHSVSSLNCISKPKPSLLDQNRSPYAFNTQSANTLILPEQNRPNMLEVVICISTSGALRDYLSVLQTRIREMIWRLQSLVPNLRIGVMAHTQGGIHDDHSRTSFGSGDHNYNRIGGHSGTKWLDLGATLSQICAFVDSLDPEPTVYPDYVQDNLEMALWKLQRCMSWSSCSYRTVIMIGRGRPNRTTFYLQKEHWRGWIRSALELKSTAEIPVIDWELEAKLLAEMGIHVFTIQGTSNNGRPGDDDEGTMFFRRVAEITQGQHVKISEPSRLVEIILGICCACHGPDLLLDHRDTVRDDNDGVLPSQLTEVFVSLQLHSKSCSLASLPSMLGNLDIAGMRQRLTNSQKTIMEYSEEEDFMETEDVRHSLSMEFEDSTQISLKPKQNGTAVKKRKNQAPAKKVNDRKHLGVKGGRIRKNAKVNSNRTNKKVKQAVETVTKKKVVNSSTKKVVAKKESSASKTKGKLILTVKPTAQTQGRKKKLALDQLSEKLSPLKRKALGSSVKAKKPKTNASSSSSKTEVKSKRSRGKPPAKAVNDNAVQKAKMALKLKAAKNKLSGTKSRKTSSLETKKARSTKKTSPIAKTKRMTPIAKTKRMNQKTPQKTGLAKAKNPNNRRNEKKNVTVTVRRNATVTPKRSVKILSKKKHSNQR